MALTDNLISVWHMNNDWQDSIGTNHGTAYGATFSASAKLGSHAGSFDGIDDYVFAGTNAQLQPANTVSVMAWINATDSAVYSTVLQYGKATGQSYGLGINIFNDNPNKLQFSFYNGTWRRVDDTDNCPLSQWVLLVGTYDGTTLKIYVNGILKNTTAYTGTLQYDSVNGVNIGRYYGGSASYFNGLIDEAAIWSRALTDGGVSVGQTATGEVAELYNGGTGIELGAAGQPFNLRGLNIPGLRQWQPNMVRR